MELKEALRTIGVLKVELQAAQQLVAAKNAELQGLHRQMQEHKERERTLEQRLVELEMRLKRDSHNSDQPPSSQPPWKRRKPASTPRRSGRKRGAQRGHQGTHRRATESVDKTVHVYPTQCTHCAHRLPDTSVKVGGVWRHQVTELPEPRAERTEYRMHTCACPQCGQRTRAARPHGVSASAFGPRLSAQVALWTGAYRLSKRQVKQLLRDTYGVRISVGAISNLEKQVSQSLELPYARVRTTVLKSPAAHADETGFRDQGRASWLWTACAGPWTLFEHSASRAKAQAQSFLDGFTGTLHVDRYGGYTWYERRQLCWAHLDREFVAWSERPAGLRKSVGQLLCRHTDTLFRLHRRVRAGELSVDTFRAQMKDVQAAFERVLTIALQGNDATLRRQAKRLLTKDWPHLFRFVDDLTLEPTNNTAERALRPAVLWRKQSYGVQSERGARFIERIMSVSATLHALGADLREFLEQCVRAQILGLTAPRLPG